MARFSIELVDSRCASRLHEHFFDVPDIDLVRSFLGVNANEEDLLNGYELDPAEVRRAKEFFGITFNFGKHGADIRMLRRSEYDPYLRHNGREYLLMCQGVKPLAYFSEFYPNRTDFLLPEHLFDADGDRFIKLEYVVRSATASSQKESSFDETRIVLYSLPHEAWRLEAFREALQLAWLTGWPDEAERQIGRLLGYSDEQNDLFLAEHHRRQAMLEQASKEAGG